MTHCGIGWEGSASREAGTDQDWKLVEFWGGSRSDYGGQHTAESARKPSTSWASRSYCTRKPEGQLQGWDAHREVTLAAQPHASLQEKMADR